MRKSQRLINASDWDFQILFPPFFINVRDFYQCDQILATNSRKSARTKDAHHVDDSDRMIVVSNHEARPLVQYKRAGEHRNYSMLVSTHALVSDQCMQSPCTDALTIAESLIAIASTGQLPTMVDSYGKYDRQHFGLAHIPACTVTSERA